MSFEILNPFDTYTSANGSALDAGKLYIGVANLDPITNPIAVFYDEALTIAAPQPIPTSGGYVWRNGAPARIYTAAETYSQRVLDKNNSQVFYSPNAALTASALNITTTAPFTGAVVRTQHDKNTETISTLDFMQPVAGDHTTAFFNASKTKGVVLVPNLGFEYVINATYENSNKVFCRFVGIGRPTIRINVLESDARPFWLQSDSGFDGFDFIQNITVEPTTSGSTSNVIMAGNHTAGRHTVDPLNPLTENVFMRNCRFNSIGEFPWNVTCFIGNVQNVDVENVEYRGNFFTPMMNHWASYTPAGGTLKTSHPRHIRIKNHKGRSEVNIRGIPGPYFSACHDVTVENLTCIGGGRGIAVVAGDYGGIIADETSRDRVMSNFSFTNVHIEDYKDYGFWISGAAAQSTGGWLAVNANPSINITNMTCVRSERTTNVLPFLRITNMRNVSVSNLIGYHKDDAVPSSTATAVDLINSVNCKIESSDLLVTNGVVITGGGHHEISLTLQGVNKRALTDSDHVGIRIGGGMESATTTAALELGQTTLTLDQLPVAIAPFTRIYFGANRFVVAANGYLPKAGAVTIEIEEALFAIGSGQSVQIETGAHDVDISGNYAGFNRNVVIGTSSDMSPRSITLSDFTMGRSGRHGVLISGGKDIVIRDGTINHSNFRNHETTSNIRADNTDGLTITGVLFEADTGADCRVPFNVHLTPNVRSYDVSSNRFFNADATKPLASHVYTDNALSTGQEQGFITSNSFSGLVQSVRGSGRINAGINIVSNNQSYAASAPTTGKWNRGDIVWNQNQGVATPLGWKCIASGDSGGTWSEIASAGSIDPSGAVLDQAVADIVDLDANFQGLLATTRYCHIESFKSPSDPDYTNAFLAACASGLRVFIPQRVGNAAYNLVGTFPIASNTVLEFFGFPTINLDVSGNHKGFVFGNGTYNAHITGSVQINTICTVATTIDGTYNTTITSGRSDNPTDPLPVRNCSVRGDIRIHCQTTKTCKGLILYGWVEDFLAEGVTVTGTTANYGIGYHWVGNGITLNPSTMTNSETVPSKTWHGHNLIFRKCKVNGAKRGYLVSAAGRATFDQCSTVNVQQPFTLFVGDYGYVFAQNITNSQAADNIIINCFADNPLPFGLIADYITAGKLGSPIWIGSEHNASVRGDFRVRISNGQLKCNGMALTGLKTVDFDYTHDETGITNAEFAAEFFDIKSGEVRGSITANQGVLLRNCGALRWSANVRRSSTETTKTTYGVTVSARVESVINLESRSIGATTIFVNTKIGTASSLRYTDGGGVSTTITIDTNVAPTIVYDTDSYTEIAGYLYTVSPLSAALPKDVELTCLRTTVGAAEAGATQLVISDSGLFYGSGGYLQYVDGSSKSWDIELDGSTNALAGQNGQQTIKTEPLPVAIPDSAQIVLIQSCKRIIIGECELSDFASNVRVVGTAQAQVRNLSLDGTSIKRHRNYGVEVGACLGYSERDVKYFGATGFNANGNNLRIGANVSSFQVIGARHTKRSDKTRYLIQVDTASAWGVIDHCIFEAINTAATSPAAIYLPTANATVKIGSNNVYLSGVVPKYPA